VAEAPLSRPEAPPPPLQVPDSDSDDSEVEMLSARGNKRPTTDSSEEEDEFPSVKFRRGEPLPSDDELGGDGNDSGSDEGPDLEEDWSMMGAELERELGDELERELGDE